jgi:gliding motility-associated-like protein
MRKYSLFCFLILWMPLALLAQGEDCNTATNLPNVSSWCSEGGAYTNVGFEDSGFTTGCFPNNQDNFDVWFSFVAEATTVNVSVAGATGQSNGGTLQNPQFAVYSGECGALTEIGCFSDAIGVGSGQLFAGPLEIGQTYYIQVGARGGNQGTFQLCVNNYNDIPDPSSDCNTGVILCDKSPFTVEQVTGVGSNPNEIGNVACSTFSCPLSESGSAWYKWTCDEPGSLTFSLTPLNPADDLDFILYQLPNGINNCDEKFDLRCMASGEVVGADFDIWEPCTGATGLADGEEDTSENCGCDPGDDNFVAPIEMEAGVSYALVVNNFSQSGNGFTVEFGGTGTFLGPEAEFRTEPELDTLCLENSITFVDESSFIGGLSGWEWTFGEDASPATATGQGPHEVTYGSPGLKSVLLRVLTSDGCIVSHVETIYVKCCESSFTIDDTIADVLCPDDSTGAIFLTVANGNPPYVFNWSNGENTPGISDLPPGNYTVTITDDFTCDSVLTYTVNSPPPLDVDTLITMPTCNGGTDGGIELQLTGGTPPYEYSWEGQPFGNDNTLTDLPVGDYEVVIRDANGCITELTIPVRELELMLDPAQPGIVNPSCTGFSDGAITINIANGQPPYQYNFNDGNGFVTTNSVSGLSAGAYTVNALDANLCEGTFNIVLEDPPLLVAGLDMQGISCFGEADALITATPEGGTGGYNIQWSTGSAEATIRGLGEGTYSYTVTDANGCVASADTTITQPPLLELSILDIQDVLCFGDTTGIVVLEGTGGVPPYEFSSDGQVFQVAPAFDSLAAGNYTFTVMDANGCLASIQGSVSQPPELIVDAGEDIRIELGYSGQIDASVSNPDVAYSWMPPDSLSCIDCEDPGANPVNTTLYTLTVTDENGCLAVDSVTVRVIKNRPVFIPNAFSPNADGRNDAFTVYAGPGARRVQELKIFNRWGGMVYEGQNFPPNAPEFGWDGTFRGEPAQIGVYAYYAKVEFIDGIVVLFEGDIQVVR